LKILFTHLRLYSMRLFVLALVLYSTLGFSQTNSETQLLARLTAGALPEAVMIKRSVVLLGRNISAKEINALHESFVRTGIDAVGYFETEIVLAGGDAQRAYSKYFTKREIGCLIFIQKKSSGFSGSITTYNGKDSFADPGQTVWSKESATLNGWSNEVYRTALSSYKKQNLLINDVAEIDLPVKIIEGNRNELFPYDLKIDNLAVPMFNDTATTKELASIFKTYPLRYQLTDNTIADRDLRNKGFLYVLCVVQGRSAIAKEVLGYTVNRDETAFVSVTYPETQLQLKNIPADVPVYKFYIRHIDSGNVFLGNKWDADTTWQQALNNFIKGMKQEFKLQ
jgi:hypothetical protein